MSLDPERVSKSELKKRSSRKKWAPQGNTLTFYENGRSMSDSFRHRNSYESDGHEHMSRSEIDAILRAKLDIPIPGSMMSDQDLLEMSSRSTYREPYRLRGNPAIVRREQASAEGWYFLALDLDECCVLGSDTNDILRVAANMINFACKKEQAEHEHINETAQAERLRKFKEIAKLLINPNVLETFQKIQAKTHHRPYVLAYTNKKKVANWIRDLVAHFRTFILRNQLEKGDPAKTETMERSMNEKWGNIVHHEGDNGSWVFLEGDGKDKSYAYLWDKFRYDTLQEIVESIGGLPREAELKKEIERISVVTWAIAEILGLDYNIPTAVSDLKYKNPKYLLKALKIPSVKKLYLFDDRAYQHYLQMPRQEHFEYNSHMIPVRAYESYEMPVQNRKMVDQYLNSLIDNDTMQEFWSANPNLLRDISVPTLDWPRHRLIYNAAMQRFEVGGGTFHRNIGSAPLPPWPTQHFVAPVHASSGRTMSEPMRRI